MMKINFKHKIAEFTSFKGLDLYKFQKLIGKKFFQINYNIQNKYNSLLNAFTQSDSIKNIHKTQHKK